MANQLSAAASLIDDNETTAGRILRETIESLRSEGVDGVQVVEIARQARVSLATIYKHFGSRDGLLLASVERWMELQTYRPLEAFAASPSPKSREEVAAMMIDYFHHIVEPWEREPRMLEVFVQVRHGPGGDSLRLKGAQAMQPAFRTMIAGLDRELTHDLLFIVANVYYGLISRFSTGEIAVTEIMPSVERTIRAVLRDRS